MSCPLTKQKCHTFSGITPCADLFVKQPTGIQDWKRHLCSQCTCSYFCPVPGRLHGTLSYSGTRMSCHYRVGGHRARSRERFTLKAIAKDGTFIRREKKRSIKGKHSLQYRTIKSQNIGTKSSANYFRKLTKELEKPLPI